ncbi:1-deoxy-D-xylulose-5-phosphate reductoisomerase, partial [Aeromonas veronii]|nr:1-deoxy-D-xylulose-5-phosphate reductoisomerase [Aeromonas veronii]
MEAVREHGAELLPIDSEHNAIFQCLPVDVQRQPGFCDLAGAGISKILLTGSGGPFRYADVGELHHVTPAQAIAHPNWSMGAKISVDSATMM